MTFVTPPSVIRLVRCFCVDIAYYINGVRALARARLDSNIETITYGAMELDSGRPRAGT